jgi:hypothetical protein
MVQPPRPQAPTLEPFVYEIRSLSPSYSFGLEQDQHAPDLYREHQSIRFVGRCRYPDRFRGRDAQVHLLGKRGLIEKDRPRTSDWSPRCIAALVASKTTFEILGGLPADACWHVGTAIAAGSIRYMLTKGTAFHGGESLLHSISFEGSEFDPAGPF